MGIKQTLSRLMRLPASIRLAEIINIMAYLGYSLEKSMQTLTIKFEKLKDGKQTAYMAVIKELGDSMVMADTLAEVFEQLPVMIESCQKNQIGIFSKTGKLSK